MPRRIFEPAWNHVRSPITLRAIALFFAIVFLAYTVISDFQQRQASAERYRAIAQYTEESRNAIVSAKEQSEHFAASIQNTKAMLAFMDEMAKSMHEVSEILRSQQREHELILNGKPRKAPRPQKRSEQKPRSKPLKECFEFVPKKKRIGKNEVTIHEGVSVPCE